MFEEWAGERAFQKAIRHYLSRYAWQSVTTDDFLKTVARSLGKEPGPAWRSFRDRPGVPVVSVGLDCDHRRPRLALEQASANWIVPYCFRTPEGAQCSFVSSGSEEVK